MLAKDIAYSTCGHKSVGMKSVSNKWVSDAQGLAAWRACEAGAPASTEWIWSPERSGAVPEGTALPPNPK